MSEDVVIEDDDVKENSLFLHQDMCLREHNS